MVSMQKRQAGKKCTEGRKNIGVPRPFLDVGLKNTTIIGCRARGQVNKQKWKKSEKIG